MSGSNRKDPQKSETTKGDPADFLLSNAKYHDCHLTVGNPTTGKVERIGVSSTHLIAHSSVFRDMLADSELADPSGSNTHITDVSPATFKLMLRHVYGGKLPNMTPEEASRLALCADKYNIQRLVGKAAKRIKPTSAEDVFLSFMCAVYINCPDLELQVSKIIQQQTDRIFQNPKFLQLDENYMLFIVKQSTLNVSELQLWNNIIRWGENQVKTRPQKTLRDCLNKILQHVRLLSLTSNKILDHVLPKRVLTPDEFMDLTLAVSKKQTLQSPGLCKVQEMRGIYIQEANEKGISNKKVLTYTHYSNPDNYIKLNQLDSKPYSTLTIKPLVDVEINTLTVRSTQLKPANDQSFSSIAFTCYIVIYESSNGLLVHTETVTLKGTAVPNENIVLQVKTNSNKSLTLKAKETYNWQVQMTPPLPVHSMSYKSGANTSDRTNTLHTNSHFTIQFEDPFHILEINYSVEA